MKNRSIVRRGEGGVERLGGPLWSPVGGAASSSTFKLAPMGAIPTPTIDGLGASRFVYSRGDPCAAKHRRRRLPWKLTLFTRRRRRHESTS